MTRENELVQMEGGNNTRVPGASAESSVISRVRTNILGLALALLLTGLSFLVLGSNEIWRPSVGVALAALAIAQMGIHLVFFLHITTGPENTNNVLALAFGVLIVFLVVSGSLWIMSNLNHNMLPMTELMDLHSQH